MFWQVGAPVVVFQSEYLSTMARRLGYQKGIRVVGYGKTTGIPAKMPDVDMYVRGSQGKLRWMAPCNLQLLDIAFGEPKSMNVKGFLRKHLFDGVDLPQRGMLFKTSGRWRLTPR